MKWSRCGPPEPKEFTDGLDTEMDALADGEVAKDTMLPTVGNGP